jgi:hypothetical protein
MNEFRFSGVAAIELEGPETTLEALRSGEWTDMSGQVVKFHAANLAQLAETLDPEEALCKIGHGPVETHTSSYGNVTHLRYDAGRDRLLATIVPTPALVRKNREEGFSKVSVELSGKLPDGPFRFQHLAFLAARKPAVRGLAPVRLAAAEGQRTFVFAESEEGRAALLRLADGLSPNIKFAESEIHDRTLIHLAELRENDPSVSYTDALWNLEELDAWNRREWAPSDVYPKVLARLAQMRKADPKTTFTMALESWEGAR